MHQERWPRATPAEGQKITAELIEEIEGAHGF
jgi:hypothetical protein